MAGGKKERNFNHENIKALEQQLIDYRGSLEAVQKRLVAADTIITDSLTGDSKTAYTTRTTAIQERFKTYLDETDMFIGKLASGNQESAAKDAEIGGQFES